MLISVHVPKTAGTSFSNQLQQHFGARLHLDYGDRPLASGYRRRMLAQRWATRGKAIDLHDFDCVHGHFLADKYAYLGASARWITWLRDPVQRIASHYHYWQRVPDLRNADCRRLLDERLSLEQFAALPRMRNVATRFLGGRALRDFLFVGVVEEMDESQRRLAQLLGIGFDDNLPHNRNDERGEIDYVVPQRVRERIEMLNRADRVLYEAACASFRDVRGA